MIFVCRMVSNENVTTQYQVFGSTNSNAINVEEKNTNNQTNINEIPIDINSQIDKENIGSRSIRLDNKTILFDESMNLTDCVDTIETTLNTDSVTTEVIKNNETLGNNETILEDTSMALTHCTSKSLCQTLGYNKTTLEDTSMEFTQCISKPTSQINQSTLGCNKTILGDTSMEVTQCISKPYQINQSTLGPDKSVLGNTQCMSKSLDKFNQSSLGRTIINDMSMETTQCIIDPLQSNQSILVPDKTVLDGMSMDVTQRIPKSQSKSNQSSLGRTIMDDMSMEMTQCITEPCQKNQSNFGPDKTVLDGISMDITHCMPKSQDKSYQSSLGRTIIDDMSMEITQCITKPTVMNKKHVRLNEHMNSAAQMNLACTEKENFQREKKITENDIKIITNKSSDNSFMNYDLNNESLPDVSLLKNDSMNIGGEPLEQCAALRETQSVLLESVDNITVSPKRLEMMDAPEHTKSIPPSKRVKSTSSEEGDIGSTSVPATMDRETMVNGKMVNSLSGLFLFNPHK